MVELTHGFKIDGDKCRGRMRCLRSCPTRAIRVVDGKASLNPDLCIDCGSCLQLCPSGAISATTITFAELDKFKFKVAVASPALFTQFGPNDTPAQVAQALLELGFDAVWEYAVDIALFERAITDRVKSWPGPFPLISSSCPVVVRLIQVSYPSEQDQRQAKHNGARPGGLIMIHGEPNVPRKPADYYASNDWTDGCIAVSNADMVDIWLRTLAGIPIEIRP